jgi:hypothetical protein
MLGVWIISSSVSLSKVAVVWMDATLLPCPSSVYAYVPCSPMCFASLIQSFYYSSDARFLSVTINIQKWISTWRFPYTTWMNSFNQLECNFMPASRNLKLNSKNFSYACEIFSFHSSPYHSALFLKKGCFSIRSFTNFLSLYISASQMREVNSF